MRAAHALGRLKVLRRRADVPCAPARRAIVTIRWMSDEQSGETQASGLFTRKGSYGAAMTNAWYFDQVVKHRPDSGSPHASASEALLDEIVQVESNLVPVIAALGMIGFFSVAEWLDTGHEGRILIAVLHLRDHPEAIDDEVRRRLSELRERVAAPALRAAIEALLAGRTPDLPDPAARPHEGTLAIALCPDVLIPDDAQGRVTDRGIFYRKGTTLAAFDNCRRYEEILGRARGGSLDPDAARELDHLVNDQQYITNMMAAGGFFELFPPLDWLRDERREGRIVAAALLLQQRPDRTTPEVAARLDELRPRVHERTRRVADGALAALAAHEDRRERTRSAIAAIVRRYLDALSRRDVAAIAELWADDPAVALMVPGIDGWARGRDAVLAYTEANFAEFASLRLGLERFECDVDLDRGDASVAASVAMQVEARDGGRYGGLEPPRRALVRIELRRLDVPSCVPALRGEGDASVGEWRIRSWTELFPLRRREGC
jgi:ketosteroid isomerase-like protein